MNETRFFSGRLNLSHALAHPPAVLHPDTTLAEAAVLLGQSGHQNAIVRDEEGSIAGVVSRSVLEQHLKQAGDISEPGWRTRSLEMLSESRCLTRATSGTHSTDESGDIPCTPVFEDGRLVALMTPDDMLVSWERMDALIRTATTDELTGLMNRQTFIRRFNEELLRSSRTNEPLSLLLIDVDCFKGINDQEGHLVGDAVLAEVAACLAHTLRRCDAVARFGGDEFVALCCDCGSERISSPIARLLQSAREIEVPSRMSRTVTLSIGVACIDTGFDEVTETGLFEIADTALYRAKAAGRDASFRTIVNGCHHDGPSRVSEQDISRTGDDEELAGLAGRASTSVQRTDTCARP